MSAIRRTGSRYFAWMVFVTLVLCAGSAVPRARTLETDRHLRENPVRQDTARGASAHVDAERTAATRMDSAAEAPADTDSVHTNPASIFLRPTSNEDGSPRAIETAIVRYGRPGCRENCATVDLIAMVHIGDRRYYRTINRLLASYGVVLFEMVLPDSLPTPVDYANIPDETGNRELYSRFARIMGMVSQAEGIDYSASNLLHADVTWSELLAEMERRGESMPDFHKVSEGLGTFECMIDFMGFDDDRRLRRMLAGDFVRTHAQEQTVSSTLVGQTYGIAIRNDKALRLLREQLDAGARRIAIIYGAKHMPDFQEHLLADFGMVPLKRRWLEAWDLR